jgi:hypothetical protein
LKLMPNATFMDEPSTIAESTSADECAIAGFGVAEATFDEIAHLRKDPGPARPEAMSFQILKHADEHTVLALAAMLNGLAALPSDTHFGDWGVVAAPRWPGRLGTANALERYRADGSRGVSPMTIPTVCLHSLSGTVSLAFGMRGPNFGVGGGLTSVADGLLAGLGLQLERRLPGTWVIFSEWSAEPGQAATPTAPRACALALALCSVSSPLSSRRRLLLRSTPNTAKRPPSPRLADLVLHLRGRNLPPGPWRCRLDWGREIVLTEGVSRT